MKVYGVEVPIFKLIGLLAGCLVILGLLFRIGGYEGKIEKAHAERDAAVAYSAAVEKSLAEQKRINAISTKALEGREKAVIVINKAADKRSNAAEAAFIQEPEWASTLVPQSVVESLK